MKRSTEDILTGHPGSLHQPPPLATKQLWK
jgi:hypothetical protein